jgi:hypothetical protein
MRHVNYVGKYPYSNQENPEKLKGKEFQVICGCRAISIVLLYYFLQKIYKLYGEMRIVYESMPLGL